MINNKSFHTEISLKSIIFKKEHRYLFYLLIYITSIMIPTKDHLKISLMNVAILLMILLCLIVQKLKVIK